MSAIGRVVDRPVIGFFAMAYGLAWGIWLLEIALARSAGLSTVDFVAAIEGGEFELVGGSKVPAWLLYLITRIQDFSFSIAGLVMIMLRGSGARRIDGANPCDQSSCRLPGLLAVPGGDG